VIDVLNTPGGMDQLLKIGVRTLPCIVMGERFTFAQNLKDVATFLNISLEREVLTPDRLVTKFLGILAAAQRMVRQIPLDKMDERVIANRPRTIRPFAYHIFRIAESFLLTYEGAEFSETMTQIQSIKGFQSVDEIVVYGEKVSERLAIWWETTSDKVCQKSVCTYYGNQSAHDVLERCTWHCAQHCRQLVAVLDRYGIKAHSPPTPELLAGLPLPEGLWV
jgi:hypothetical protein